MSSFEGVEEGAAAGDAGAAPAPEVAAIVDGARVPIAPAEAGSPWTLPAVGLFVWLAASFALAWVFRENPAFEVVGATAAAASAAAATAAVPAAGTTFSWAVIGELALVLYAYSVAAQKGEWRAVYLGLAFWAGELLWEMANALVGHFLGAPLFGLRGQSAWHIYAGLNVEITLMFALVPLVLFGLLPKDPDARLGKVSARVAVPVLLGLFCVAVEVMLNRAGALVWSWWFWRWPHIGVICFAYCAPFVLLVAVYDRVTDVARCRGMLVRIGAAAAICHLVLHTWLGWVRPAAL